MSGSNPIGPPQHDVHLGRGLPFRQVDGTQIDLTGGPVEADRVAFTNHDRSDRELSIADVDHLCAAHRRLAPAPCHHGGVAGQAPLRREDAFGDRHAVDVLRRRLVFHQDHVVALVVGLDGSIRAEVDLADRSPRRRS